MSRKVDKRKPAHFSGSRGGDEVDESQEGGYAHVDVDGFTQCCGRCGQNIFDEPACIAPPRAKSKPKPSKRKPDMAERIYSRLFEYRGGRTSLAITGEHWPGFEPDPRILAAIRAVLSEGE